MLEAVGNLTCNVPFVLIIMAMNLYPSTGNTAIAMASSEIRGKADSVSSQLVSQVDDAPLLSRLHLGTTINVPDFVSSSTRTYDHLSLDTSTHLSLQTQHRQWEEGFGQLLLSTDDIKRCMQGKETLRLNTSHLAWLYQQHEQASHTMTRTESYATGVCWLTVTTPQNTIAKLEFVEQTCSTVNNLFVWVQVNESFNYFDVRTGCEDFYSPLLYEYLGLGNWVTFGLVIHDPLSSYVVRLNVTAAPRLKKTQLHMSSEIGTVYPCVCLLVCLPVCLSVCMPVCLSVCMYMSVCVCLLV